MYSYIVSYDLIQPDKDYSSLISAIKEYGTYAKILESCWIIKSSHPSKDIRDNLMSYIDNNDKIFVAQLTGQSSWLNLSNEVSDWIHKNT